MIMITGASGQLGRFVIEQLLDVVPAAELAVLVRNPEKVADLAAKGVTVRQGEYTQPATLTAAFAGIEKLLLISSSEVGQRLPQHKNVIEAAQKAGIKLLAYTSLLHCDSSPLGLAEEHKATEQSLADSGIPYVLLRNSWYSENYAGSIQQGASTGSFIGAAAQGKIASASRADYAAAAVAVLTTVGHEGKVYELAGDEAFTLDQLAAEIARQAHTDVTYNNLSAADYREALLGVGLPAPVADMLANSDAGAAQDGLYDDSKQLSQLIGRATTPIAETVKQVLAAQA